MDLACLSFLQQKIVYNWNRMVNQIMIPETFVSEHFQYSKTCIYKGHWREPENVSFPPLRYHNPVNFLKTLWKILFLWYLIFAWQSCLHLFFLLRVILFILWSVELKFAYTWVKLNWYVYLYGKRCRGVTLNTIFLYTNNTM